jgi:pSer/pThr/pTyr-binding forkhead associated (FHA) protein
MTTALQSPPSQQQEPVTQTLDALPRLTARDHAHSVADAEPRPGRYLRVDAGDVHRLIPLDRDVLHLGRSLHADVCIDDHSVSRRHAILVQRRDGVRVLDDRSVNGTFVNGRRVTVQTLTPGDVLVLGQVVLTYLDVR